MTMKLTKCILFTLLFLATLSLKACRGEEVSTIDEYRIDSSMSIEDIKEYETMDGYNPQYVSSTEQRDYSVSFLTSKAADSTLDGNKKFIRTASLRFSVADVLAATHAIEDITITNKGFIISSTLNNDELYSNETRVSKDSILVQTENRLTGILTLKVPHSRLDATLREIALLAGYITYRNVNADEVTFRILGNSLEQARKKDKAARIKSTTGTGKGHKLEDLLAAEELIDKARLEADEAIVSEKKLYDKIAYSTITISLSQAPTIVSTMKLAVEEAPQYKQGFFENVGHAIVSGWYGLLDTIEILFAIWPLLLFIGGTVFAIIYFRKKKRKRKVIV